MQNVQMKRVEEGLSQLSTSSRVVEEKEPVQLTLLESIDCTRQYPPSSSQAQELNQAVCSFLAKGMHPVSTVEEAGFRNIMYKLHEM